MANVTYGGSTADFTYGLETTAVSDPDKPGSTIVRLKQRGGTALTLWTAATGGSQVTIVSGGSSDAAGNISITASYANADTAPAALYVDSGTGTRWRVERDVTSTISTLQTNVTALQGSVTPAIPTKLTDLSDVTVPDPTTIPDQAPLSYNATTGQWGPGVPANPTTVIDTVAELTDVNLAGLTTGRTLTWNGTAWVPFSFPLQVISSTGTIDTTWPDGTVVLAQTSTASLKSHAFDGTNGAVVTAAAEGFTTGVFGASQPVYDTGNKPAGITSTSSAKWLSAGGRNYYQDTSFFTGSALYWRFYFMAGAGTMPNNINIFSVTGSGGTGLNLLTLQIDRTIDIKNNAAHVAYTPALTASVWYRIEGRVASGNQIIRVYTHSTNTLITPEINVAAATTGNPVTAIIGSAVVAFAGGIDLWVDQLDYSDSWLGPAA